MRHDRDWRDYNGAVADPPLVPVPLPIRLELRETVRSGGAQSDPRVGPEPQLLIFVGDEENYHSTCPFDIVSRMSHHGSDFALTLEGLKLRDEGCGGGLTGWASQRLPRNTRNARLSVKYAGRTDEYRVRITDSTLDIDPIRVTLSKAITPHRWRARRLSVAVYCLRRHNPRIGDPALCDQFEAELTRVLGATPLHFGEGRANPFPLLSDMTEDQVRYFRLSGAGDFLRAYDMLQAYPLSPTTMSETFIEMRNWRGAGISSYRCQPDQDWCQKKKGRYPAQ